MTRPRTPTLTAAATLAFVAVAVAVPAAAADGPARTTDGGTTTIELEERENEGGGYIPKGGTPQEWPEDPDFVPNEGDAFTFTSDLLQDGDEVGSNSGTCTILDLEANLHRCVVTFTFADGTFVADGRIAFPEDSLPEPFTVAITSGTGAYAGARGTLTVTEREQSNALKAAYSTGGQVSEVPAGGADAGGGFGDGSDDNAVLLGLGALATAAGAGLVLGGRRLALRRD